MYDLCVEPTMCIIYGWNEKWGFEWLPCLNGRYITPMIQPRNLTSTLGNSNQFWHWGPNQFHGQQNDPSFNRFFLWIIQTGRGNGVIPPTVQSNNPVGKTFVHVCFIQCVFTNMFFWGENGSCRKFRRDFGTDAVKFLGVPRFTQTCWFEGASAYFRLDPSIFQQHPPFLPLPFQ